MSRKILEVTMRRSEDVPTHGHITVKFDQNLTVYSSLTEAFSPVKFVSHTRFDRMRLRLAEALEESARNIRREVELGREE